MLIAEEAFAYIQRTSQQAEQRVEAARIAAEIRERGGLLPGIRARLYPYQVEGVAFLASTGRAMLADDMGLGKTLQAICAAVWMGARRGVQKVLVVCPASLKHQWAREIERFTGQEAVVIRGGPAHRAQRYASPATFVISSYELVMRDLSVIQATLCPDLLILDEAQRIRNWRTRVSTAIKAIPARYSFVLTGTPLENRLEDLYSLMQAIDPEVMGPLWRTLHDFHVLDANGKVLGYRNLSELRRRLTSVMLRRDRRLVRDQLPDKVLHRRDIPLDAVQRELHDSALRAASVIAQVMARRPLTPEEEHRFMAALQSARMACNAAGLVDKETQGSPKLDELARLLEELCVEGGEKVVIFSQWEQMTRMAEAVVQGLGLRAERLHGGVPSDLRGPMIDRFREDPAVQVFLSTDAGATGLNLQVASALINLDVPWNPAVLEQRIARIHRLGQRRSVQIITLVGADSYEQRVMEILQGKRALLEGVVNPESNEEVMGLSRRVIDMALEIVSEPEAPTQSTRSETEPAFVVEEAVDVSPVADAPAPTTEKVPEAPAPAAPAADPLNEAVAALHRALGRRIVQVVAAGEGLVVVVDQVRPEDEALVTDQPITLLTERQAMGLLRLGMMNGASLYTRAGAPTLAEQAAHKHRAAEALFDAACLPECLAALAEALLLAASARAGRSAALTAAEAPVWLYTEAVPRGQLDATEAALILRALALAASPGLPAAVVHSLLGEGRRFVESSRMP